MAHHAIEVDQETKQVLDEIVAKTGDSESAVVKRGLMALREHPVDEPSRPSAYELYKQFDLGPGGYAIAPAADSRKAVREALRRKHGR